MHGHLNIKLVNNDLVTTWKEALSGYVARMGEKRKAYRVWVGKPEGKRPLGRHTRALSIILKDLQEIQQNSVDWIYPPQNREKWRALVRTLIICGFCELHGISRLVTI